MSSHNKNNIFMPPELIENILLRLPLYKLTCAKAVCRDWKSLIESPRFVDSYHKDSEENNHNNQLVSVISISQKVEICTIGLQKFAARSPYLYTLKNKCRLTNKIGKLIGSCNGLLCFTDGQNRILLCNPSTKTRYAFHFNGPTFVPGDDPCYGFGYDRNSYDYKVVCIVMNCDVFKWRIEVYSLKTKSLKRLEFNSKGHLRVFDFCSHGVFVNNSLHWLVDECVGQSDLPTTDSRILSFDLCSEEISLLPWHNDMKMIGIVCLDVLDGCLCAWFPGCNGEVETWIMKKHGVVESWTKLLTIQFHPLTIFLISQLIKPVALSKDGSKLLLATPNYTYTEFCCYDINTSNKIWDIKMQNCNTKIPYQLQTSLQSKLSFLH